MIYVLPRDVDSGCMIYCRAIDAEVSRLRAAAGERGWQVLSVITDSPAIAPVQRIGLMAACRAIAEQSGKVLMVPCLPMLGATLGEAVTLIAKLAEAKVDLFIEAEAVDSTTVAGRSWLATVASLSGYQRALRLQNIRAGQLRAKEAGVRFGRKPIPNATLQYVRSELAAGGGIRPTARKVGISAARVAMEQKAMLYESPTGRTGGRSAVQERDH